MVQGRIKKKAKTGGQVNRIDLKMANKGKCMAILLRLIKCKPPSITD